MSELLRMSDITIGLDQRSGLEHFNCSICVGQTQAFSGNHEHFFLFGLLSGELVPQKGYLYFDGKEVSWEEYRSIAAKTVVHVGYDRLLNEEMTVWENVSVIFSAHRNLNFHIQRNLPHLIQEMMEEAGIELDSMKKVSVLTVFERVRLQIFALVTKNTRMVLVDFSRLYASLEELRLLDRQLSLLKKRGISVVFFCNQNGEIPRICDRMIFLLNGHNLKEIEYGLEIKERSDAIADVLYTNPHVDRTMKTEGGHCALKFQCNPLKEQELFSKEISAMIFPTAQSETQFEDRIKKNDWKRLLCSYDLSGRKPEYGKSIVFLEMRSVDRVMDEMTPEEYLLLRMKDKLRKIRYTEPELLSFIKNEFNQWIGELSVFEAENCSYLSNDIRVALNLYPVLLSKPDVLFVTDIHMNSSYKVAHVVRRTLVELAEAGCSVCVLTSDPYFADEIVNRYISLEDMNDG